MAARFDRDYGRLDRPEILRIVFHPRPEWGPPASPHAHLVRIPVGTNPTGASHTDADQAQKAAECAEIAGRFHAPHPAGPNILFFHGNGETVGDYDDVAARFAAVGANLLAVGYRGYGDSTGTPTNAAMLADCHEALAFTRQWLAHAGHTGPLVAMGRSLGSVSALELAAAHPGALAGLILESALAYSLPLLKLFGMSPARLGLTEADGYGNVEKIATWQRPLLLLHGEDDDLLPVDNARILFDACPAARKTLCVVRHAGHNDIFLRGERRYMDAVASLLATLDLKPPA
ncbi:MAG: alpha/beta hydrolase [Desulfovibrionaceae bacterium]